VAITYPFAGPNTTQPLLWQAADGFGFRLLGGYAHHPNTSPLAYSFPDLMNPPGLQQFLTGQDPDYLHAPGSGYIVPSEGPSQLSPALVATTRAALSAYDVRLVIVDNSHPGSGSVTQLFEAAIGPPTLSSGRFTVWADWHGPPR
jgi:hypothetical protein